MRLFVSAVLAAALFTSNVMAVEPANLAPGKPAGVKNAQLADNTVVIGLGVGLIAAGIAVAASAGDNHANITGTTTATAP